MKNKCVEFLSIMEEKGFDLSPNNYQAAAIALYKVFGADKLLSLKTSVLSSLVQKAHQLGTPHDEEIKKIENGLKTLDSLREFGSELGLKISDIKEIMERRNYG